jgi:NAD(P)-dependent dehydrogenase (short-subunit alcohol dehydrogenase family)
MIGKEVLSMSTQETVAIVTGGSRGAGRGIAVALGSHGCTVYVTGRSEKAGDHALPGTIHETAQAVTAAGGKGIPVRVDHAEDAQTKALIDQVEREQGRVDILVSNACALYDELTAPGHFWEKPLKLVEMIDVGLHGGYAASYYAAPLMVKQRRGLIVFTSSSGAVHYCLGPAYGAHKAGLDKFAHDMAVDLRDFDVAALSIWMGPVRTARQKEMIAAYPDKYGSLENITETAEFTGHIIWALYNDPKLMDISGKALIGAEAARMYGILDEGGRQPPSYRERRGVAPYEPYPVVIR